MRISDWSSDVGSSDLVVGCHGVSRRDAQFRHLVALADRRLDWPIVHDLRRDLTAGVERQNDVDVAVADERHVVAGSGPPQRTEARHVGEGGARSWQSRWTSGHIK